MTNENILDAIGMINEEAVREAKAYRRPKSRNWIKWGAVAACLFLIIGIGVHIDRLNEYSGTGSGPFGNGDATLFEPHRGDFSSEIDHSILSQFDENIEVKKAYILRTNDWFLSDVLSDFSQVVTTDIIYVAPGGKESSSSNMAYSFYNINENGEIEWNSSAYPSDDASAPFGFAGLTYGMIDNALAEIDYEDYIITYSQRLNTVFVWVWCEGGDVFITYPTRPDLLGLEIGSIYTLDDIQTALTNAYNN